MRHVADAFRQLPLWYKVSLPARILLLPIGIVFITTGSSVVGLIFIVAWVIDQAVVSPLILARARRQARS